MPSNILQGNDLLGLEKLKLKKKKKSKKRSVYL